MADDLKIVADYSDLQLMRRELVGISKDAKSSAAVFEREFSKVERQLVKQEKELRRNVKASQSFYNQLLGVDRATKSASSSAAVFERELTKVENATIRATAAQRTFENTSRKGMRNTEVIAQQAGYQIGDLAVQIQGGTNAAVAFGQQGSQLLGFFGPMGALAGAALAISTAFIAPFMKAGEEVDKVREKTEELIKTLREANELRGIGGEVPKQIAETTKELIDLENKIRRMEESVQRRVKGRSGTDYEKELKRLLEVTKENNEEVYKARDAKILELRLLDAQQKAQKALTGDVALEGENLKNNAEYQRDKLAAAEEALKNMEDILGSSEGLNQSTEAQNKMFGQLVSESEKFLGFVEAAEGDANRLAKLDIASGINAAAIEASNLSEDMKQSLKDALGIVRLAKDAMSLDPFGGEGDSFYNTSRTVYPSWEEGSDRKTKTKSKSGAKKKDPAKELEKFMAQQEQANALQKQGIMLGEESVRVTELINKYKEAGVTLDLQRIQNLAEEEQRLQTLQYAHDSLTNALMSVVDGTQSVGQAFKGLIVDMLLEIYRQQVAKNFASTVLGLFGFANGGVFSNGSQVNAFADGGVVGGPTYFPMSGGQTGLMGEAGPEAIMPLKRGANGKLGVQMSGGGEQVVINQNINISTGVQQTVRNEIKSMMPQIAAQSKSAVLDAKRRGGSYGGKF